MDQVFVLNYAEKGFLGAGERLHSGPDDRNASGHFFRTDRVITDRTVTMKDLKKES
jgi:hypothetical protein